MKPAKDAVNLRRKKRVFLKTARNVKARLSLINRVRINRALIMRGLKTLNQRNSNRPAKAALVKRPLAVKALINPKCLAAPIKAKRADGSNPIKARIRASLIRAGLIIKVVMRPLAVAAVRKSRTALIGRLHPKR